MLSHSDFGGRQYGYSYDNAGQLTFDSGLNRQYEYNAEGLLSRILEQDNHIAYDAMGRLTNVVRPAFEERCASWRPFLGS